MKYIEYVEEIIPEEKISEVASRDLKGTLEEFQRKAWSYDEELSYDHDKEAAAYIIAAQVASDMGKWSRGGWWLTDEDYDEMEDVSIKALRKGDPELYRKIEAGIVYGYDIKDAFIALAITKASHSKRFHYHVEERPDQNGNMSIVTYFEWLAKDGSTEQVSFHSFRYDLGGNDTPCGGLLVLLKNRARDCFMKWNHVINGSREACKQLLLEFA